jgi:negative regulator of replication initiation
MLREVGLMNQELVKSDNSSSWFYNIWIESLHKRLEIFQKENEEKLSKLITDMTTIPKKLEPPPKIYWYLDNLNGVRKVV